MEIHSLSCKYPNSSLITWKRERKKKGFIKATVTSNICVKLSLLSSLSTYSLWLFQYFVRLPQPLAGCWFSRTSQLIFQADLPSMNPKITFCKLKRSTQQSCPQARPLTILWCVQSLHQHPVASNHPLNNLKVFIWFLGLSKWWL